MADTAVSFDDEAPELQFYGSSNNAHPAIVPAAYSNAYAAPYTTPFATASMPQPQGVASAGSARAATAASAAGA